MKRVLTVIAVLLLATTISAQQTDRSTINPTTTTSQSGIGMRPAWSPFSLLSNNRVTWSHSYSVTFFSGGSSSGQAGLWRSAMDFDLAKNFHVRLNLGVMHNPGSLWNNQQNTDAQFLPGVQIDWRPSKNVYLSVSYQQYAGYYSPYYPYYNRYGSFSRYPYLLGD